MWFEESLAVQDVDLLRRRTSDQQMSLSSSMIVDIVVVLQNRTDREAEDIARHFYWG